MRNAKREKVFWKTYSLENSLRESIFREDLFLYNHLQLSTRRPPRTSGSDPSSPRTDSCRTLWTVMISTV